MAEGLPGVSEYSREARLLAPPPEGLVWALLALLAFGCSSPAAPDADPSKDTSTTDVRFDAPPDMPGPSDQGLDLVAVSDLLVADSGTDAPDVADAAFDATLDLDVAPDLPPCVPPADELEPISVLPQLLSETGLFSDITTQTFRADVQEFVPRFPLWSDGAEKTRWVWLPACSTIDNTDPDHWVIPVGARFWKRFVVDGTTVETRFIHRFGPGPDDFLFGAYLWAEDDSDAVLVPTGTVNARGTLHDVPSIQACEACHTRLPERILGFGQIQLDHSNPGVTLADVAARLVVPAGSFTVPGDALAQAALGYMHGNCANCHNDTPDAVQFPGKPLSLRLSVSDVDVSSTGVGRTAIDVPIDRFSHPQCGKRIDPGSSDTSCLPLRMELRGRLEQMPPIGTEQPDPVGIEAVRTFIDSL